MKKAFCGYCGKKQCYFKQTSVDTPGPFSYTYYESLWSGLPVCGEGKRCNGEKIHTNKEAKYAGLSESCSSGRAPCG